METGTSGRKRMAFSVVSKARRLIGLPLIGQAALGLALLIGHDRLEMLVRGTSMLRRVDAQYPFYCGRHVVLRNRGNLTIGSDVHILDNVVINAGTGVLIGSGVQIGTATSIQGYGRLEIGDGCILSGGVRIWTQSKYRTLKDWGERSSDPFTAPVRLGQGVKIGANAVVLPGVTLGDNSAVAALSMVTKDVPPDTAVAGIPAKPFYHHG